MVDVKNTESKKKDSVTLFEKEISKLPPELKEKLLAKKDVLENFVKIVRKKVEGKSIGFYVVPEFELKNNVPTPNFDKLSLHFLLDDFEKPISLFDYKMLLGDDFDKLEIHSSKNKYGEEVKSYTLKADKDIKFVGKSITIIRENCFDSIYDDLKSLGSCFIYEDNRGFISALKSIDIHRNMLLQKFEKYVVAYVGAGSWLRGEKSNDFDVFIVIDDTDVKRMPRYQVKDQLTKIIWQMSREVSALTGIQIHIQVYLLTDFWDALKDAHPVMFTFLRDGVPFYDRGIYSAWKELLKLGKIKPSPEAIDMHMNAGNQLIDRAKAILSDVFMNEIYNSVLSPSQAMLMLKGYNPTTPKETVKLFKEVLLEKEGSITKEEYETLEMTVKKFKEIEHNKEIKLSGTEFDSMIKRAEKYLAKIKKMFEQISEDKTKESIVFSYNELLTQVRTLPGYTDISEKKIFELFTEEYLDSGKLPGFIKKSLNNFVKAKADFDKGKITASEVNKVLKESRNIQAEIKNYRDNTLLSEINKMKVSLTYDKNKVVELANAEGKVYLYNLEQNKIYLYKAGKFAEEKITWQEVIDKNLEKVSIDQKLIDAVKTLLKVKEIFF
jgi:uncharacterized protein (UPF0332 family)